MKTTLYKLFFGFVNLVSLLPFWILHRISDILYFLIYYVVGYRKKLVFRNMQNSFPEKSDSEIKEIMKQFYQHFADLLIESVKSSTIGQKEFQKRYHVKNWDKLLEFLSTGKSLIVLSPHTGNWEWVFALVHRIPCTVYAIYQTLMNPYVTTYIKDTRQRYGAVMISRKETFGKVLGSIENKEQTLTWMAADQACKPNKATWVKFLGQDTTFHGGYEALAKQTGQAVYFLDIKKVKRSYYELDFILIAETPQDVPERGIVKEFARLTEKRIEEDPAYWLWSHNRWKHKREKNTF